MDRFTVPDIIAIIAALTALSAPFARSYIDRRKTGADIDKTQAETGKTKADTFSIVTGRYDGMLERMEKQIAAQEVKIDKLTIRIEELEAENLAWQREYRVVWDGAKANARQIVELGKIPAFDPPVQTFRGTLD